ncbi:MAG: hypothetical protein R3282_00180 [Rhodothermales bacterium]|nr:hypothetical protein [Rhodothermales bacterium]
MFSGRKRQIVVHAGCNISPQDIEEALPARPAAAPAGAVGVHDLAHGENVCADAALHAGVTAPSASDLIEFTRERVGYKAPEDTVDFDRRLTLVRRGGSKFETPLGGKRDGGNGNEQ